MERKEAKVTNNRCHCCLLMLWARAIGGILADHKAIDDVIMQRNRHPSNVSDEDFFKECGWAIYVTGFSEERVREKWSQLEEAFLRWGYKNVCQDKDKVRANALRVINNAKKAKAMIAIAEWMCQTGWETIRKRLLNGLTKDEYGNVLPQHELISYLDQRPMIGRRNAIFILKNVGYDVAKADSHLTSLAPKFGYVADEKGVQQFATDIAKLVLERISVVDTVLWWAAKLRANLSFKCPACGRQH